MEPKLGPPQSVRLSEWLGTMRLTARAFLYLPVEFEKASKPLTPIKLPHRFVGNLLQERRHLLVYLAVVIIRIADR